MSRAIEDYPRNLAEFAARFRTETACRDYLISLRWPSGFRCPRCKHDKAWPVRTVLFECARCGAQTSVLAGTIFQDARQPLTQWFRAMWCVTTSKTGTSALSLQQVLGLGSYKTAWSWLHKLRRAMVRPDRDRLSGRVEVDETFLGAPIMRRVGPARSNKVVIGVAVEEDGDGLGRVRMRRLADASTASLRPFVDEAVDRGSVVHTDGWLGYDFLERRGYRQEDVPAQTRPVSNGEINRELQILKRIFSLAIESGRLATKPKISMLTEAPARAGFFEREQYESVLAHLPAEIRLVIQFAYITGWRIADEILPLEWRQVDFEAGEVRLDAGTTKNREGRVFPFTTELRTVLMAQHAAHRRLKLAGHIFPNVFWRMVADERGGKQHPKVITRFDKSWKIACRAAGCPGRIPHDLRRTAIRNFVRSGTSENVAMKLSGHKTRSVFDRYDIVSGDDLREAARRLNVAAGH